MHVVIYTMEGCPYCEKAKSFLQDKEIEFREVDVSPGSRDWLELKEKTGSGLLPQVLVNGAPIGGYSNLVDLETTGELYQRLGLVGRKSDTPLYDVIILGAGPAGLSAAIYTSRKLLKTLIISKDIGGQVAWSAEVQNYLGFSQVNAEELVAKFQQHVRDYGVEQLIGEEVGAVDMAGPVKKVVTGDGRKFLGKTLIIATGGMHRPLNIAGEREMVGKGVSYCSTCDAPLFRNAEVAVVGGGNSGLEAVLDLINIAARIYLVSLTELTGDPIYQDKIKNLAKVEILTGHRPLRVLGGKMVEGLEVGSLKTGETRVLKVDGVFVEIGIMPNSSLFIDTLAANQTGEILIDSHCRTGLNGVFACGDVTSVPFKQVVVAVGEGAKAALSAYEFLINQK